MILRLALVVAVVFVANACSSDCVLEPPVQPADPCPPGAASTCPTSQFCGFDAGVPLCVDRKLTGSCTRDGQCLSAKCDTDNGRCIALVCP